MCRYCINKYYFHYKTPTEPIKLSVKDSFIFIDSIINAREPNALLKSLFSKYNDEIFIELLAQNYNERVRNQMSSELLNRSVKNKLLDNDDN